VERIARRTRCDGAGPVLGCSSCSLLASASLASAKGLCARGRFELVGATGREVAALGGVVLDFDEGTVELEGMCSAPDVGRSCHYGHWQYRTRLRLAEPCGSTRACASQEGCRCDLTDRWYTRDARRSGVGVPLDPSCEGVEASAVCGCDGVTYPSDCARQQAHVDLFGPGPCSLP